MAKFKLNNVINEWVIKHTAGLTLLKWMYDEYQKADDETKRKIINSMFEIDKMLKK